VTPVEALKRRTRSGIDWTNRADSRIDLDGLRLIESLASGVCGNVNLMEDEDGERYPVKYLAGRWHRTVGMASDSFSRESQACGKFSHPRIVPVCVFSAVTQKSETAFIMEYMESRLLAGFLKGGKAGKGDRSRLPRELGSFLLDLPMDLSLFVRKDLCTEI
jgi:hypothetical protein